MEKVKEKMRTDGFLKADAGMQAQVVSGSSKHTVTAANGISYELDSIVTPYSVRTSDFKATVGGNAIASAPSRLYTGMADDGASIFLSQKDLAARNTCAFLVLTVMKPCWSHHGRHGQSHGHDGT